MSLTPCQQPDRDPDDWFIESNGKQYKDDDILTQEEYDAVVVSFGDDLSLRDEREDAVQAAEREKIRLALIRRRKAKEACHFECPVRLQCLDVRLKSPVGFAGTWGGYYPEELAQIESAKAEHDARRT